MKYLFGNWKMYLSVEESLTLAKECAHLAYEAEKIHITVFPNTLAFVPVEEVLRESGISVGAQNVNWVPKGAYTGAVSAFLFQAAGATHALVGHSERRYIFGETDEAVRKKIEACLDAGISPVVCVGETKEDRENNKEEYRIKKQIMKAFDGLPLAGKEVFVAYEPVWAISNTGAGSACDPIEVERMSGLIHEELKEYTDQNIPIIYGGSVDAQNVLSYVSLESVSGILPGHASTEYADFLGMVEAVCSV
jgi:triosephosphate isomerase